MKNINMQLKKKNVLLTNLVSYYIMSRGIYRSCPLLWSMLLLLDQWKCSLTPLLSVRSREELKLPFPWNFSFHIHINLKLTLVIAAHKIWRFMMPSVCKFYRKTPVLESLFNKVTAATLLTRDSKTGVFLWNLRNF